MTSSTSALPPSPSPPSFLNNSLTSPHQHRHNHRRDTCLQSSHPRMSRPRDRGPGRFRPLPAVPFPATESTSASARSSPLHNEDDDVQFLGPGPVARVSAMPDKDNLETRLVRLEALGTKMTTLENNNTALSGKITTLESDITALRSRNAGLEAEAVVLKDRIENLESQSLNPQLSQSLPEPASLDVARDGSVTEIDVIEISGDKETKSNKSRTALGIDMYGSHSQRPNVCTDS
ncbi:hypothetical protein DL98DRAFT_276701 [Cadophora sp. DSE1049]|nr:hypothetical protein DL98DRAFT_276701 [Cadophora sp. DSE1049]